MHSTAIGEAVGDATAAYRRGGGATYEAALDRLIVADRSELSATLVGRLEAALAKAWARGWQPADVRRYAARGHTARHLALAEELIARQASAYVESAVDYRWSAQLTAARVAVDDPGTFLEGWAQHTRVDPYEAVRIAVETLSTVEAVPVVPHLIAAPDGSGPASRSGRRPRGASRSADPAARMLDRVRALLAKAESSGYPQEAEAFTIKAQELTARYRLDVAALNAWPDDRTATVAIRVGIDAPYEDAKAMLLQNVAEANLARAVWSSDLGFSTVVGFPSDVDTVELLYASILVQATAIMVREGSGRRARDFRESFLHGYAARIAQRLQASNDQVWTDANDLLPVLASREEAVRERIDEVFGGLSTGRARVRDGRGWRSGTEAADAAQL